MDITKRNFKYNENILVEKMRNYLNANGYYFRENVPNLNRCADIAALDENEKVIVYECKINDYRKAIEQLKTHMLCADEVYIVTFEKDITQKILDEIIKNGIGLILFSFIENKFKIKISAKRTSCIWSKGYELLQNYIKEVA